MPLPLKKQLRNLFENKTILITGGTGFLGRHLVKNILPYGPHSIRVLSRDEVKHHYMQQLFAENPLLRHFIGDVRDYDRLRRAAQGADIVIHAAALKRLDMIEYNVDESIKTNILGTVNVVQACLENNVTTAVFVSTDKACSPINTYGACKFLAERIFSVSNRRRGSAPTIFTIVRYGNVLESTGSVIPFFTQKIKDGEDIPLTDPRMTRFIISPEQAVHLVFDAIAYGRCGEIFVPKLPAFRIIDLIDILKEKYQAKNRVKIVGIRPGEKIHEYMVNEAEMRRTYEFKNMYVIASEVYPSEDGEFVLSGTKVPEGALTHYSSDQAVIGKEEILSLFKKYKLL
ncbi:SDR family NAD(P)-dependent oxidoreductase [Candidatus Woesearchaeota archaeon]|nr:SDR family NAD(P)-dependent oxidoreductase [Candidatus Woesearchaeota archaeon]